MEIVLKLLDWSLRQNWALGWPIVCFIALMCVPALRNTAVTQVIAHIGVICCAMIARRNATVR
ncbi:hypothetical protein N8969_00605 [bacterium]|nr:hypothetical protein [bacterium]